MKMETSEWKEEAASTPVERARDYGIDISLLEENFRLTPLERLRRHDEAVTEILLHQQKVIQLYGSL